MEALFWIAGISISIFLAFRVGRLFSKGNKKEKVKAARVTGLSVAGFWLLWTFGFSTIFVGYALTGPLAIFQTIEIIVVFLVRYRIFFKEEK